jgi:hypothetical protein
MNPDSDAADRQRTPHEGQSRAWPPTGYYNAGEAVVTHNYEVRENPRQFSFDHDKAAGLFVIKKADGTVERFRDNPTRYLVVEPNRETGKLQPAVKQGQPVYLYLARQDRES